MCTKKFLEMDKVFALATLLALCLVKNALTAPYANDYPYQKYGFNRETSQGDSDSSRFYKSKLRDEDGRLKVNSDTGLIYNLDSNTNKHDLHQIKRGGTTDNLTHVQGEDFETDKTHKRKHIKSGFQNSYHKDENGSRSSFYEDSDDTGGKTVYDKRHGTRGDQQESQHTEGLKNGVSRDKYDDRKTGFDNRDHADRQQTYVEDQGKSTRTSLCFPKQSSLNMETPSMFQFVLFPRLIDRLICMKFCQPTKTLSRQTTRLQRQLQFR